MTTIPRTSGIYQILCIPTGKVYIGSAVNLQSRWSSHLARLRNGTSHTAYLQSAWGKYGEEAFVFSVIEPCPREQLVQREQFHIDRTECYNRLKGFNSRRKAESNIGAKFSPEASARLSAFRRGKPRGPMPEDVKVAISMANRGKRKPPRSEEAKRMTSQKLKGHVTTEETRRKIGAANRGRVPNAVVRAANVNAISKDWFAVSPDGVEYRFRNLEGFCREHALTATGMRYVAQGKNKQHKGWTCRYA